MKRYILGLIAVLIGAVTFFLIIGPNALDPRNIAWVQVGDPAQHYLGWVFYRYSPWTLPLGLNPNFGLDISSSIVYSDSIPLLAIFFKLFSPWLPEPFQYLGLWMLACFILQAYFGLRLLSLITPKLLLQVLGAAFFVISPIMLWRMGLHAALAGHFLILAALYLVLRPLDKQTQGHQVGAWVLLLGCASLIHAYLLAMGLILWGVDLLSRSQVFARQQERANLSAVLPTLIKVTWEIILVLVILAGVMWQAGYFIGNNPGNGLNFGTGHMNTLGLIDSGHWSYVIKDIPTAPDDFNVRSREYESFMFLGMGLLFFGAFVLWALRYNKNSFSSILARYPYFLIALLVMTLFSLTHQVGIGSSKFEIPMPDQFLALASILRASARLFWPVYYTIILWAIYIVIKSYSKKVAIAILATALVIQVVDTSIGWLLLRKNMMLHKTSEMGSPLKDSFWQEAAKNYDKVLVVLPLGRVDWRDIASYAAKYHMGTNAVYLARYDVESIDKSTVSLLNQINTGQYNQKTLYIIEDNRVIQAFRHYNSNSDFFARIDNLNVLAPNWGLCKQCVGSQTISNWVPVMKIDQPIFFSRSSKYNYPFVLGVDWSYPEEWGAWSSDKQASLTLPLPAKQEYTKSNNLMLTVHAFITQKHPTQEFEIWVNGHKEQDVTLNRSTNNQIIIPISKAIQNSGYVNLEFKFKNPARPKDEGMGDDIRLLGIGLISAVFTK